MHIWDLRTCTYAICGSAIVSTWLQGVCTLCVHGVCTLCVHGVCTLCVHGVCTLCVHGVCTLCVYLVCAWCVYLAFACRHQDSKNIIKDVCLRYYGKCDRGRENGGKG